MILDRAPRKTFEERLQLGLAEWTVSGRLFGDTGSNIYDFEIQNYVYFLDHVGSLDDLIQGLAELSPFCDDALELAERMTFLDFADFKIALPGERRASETGESSRFPHQFDTLLIPSLFFAGRPMADTFLVPLGAAMVRILELGSSPAA